MTETISNITVENDGFDDAKEQREQFLQTMLPPLNKDAVKLHEVYKLYDLIDETILNRMHHEAIEVLKCEPDELP